MLTTRALYLIFVYIGMNSCGTESKSSRVDHDTLQAASNTDKKQTSSKDSTQNPKSNTDEKIDPKALADKLEKQGLTNNGSPLVNIHLSQGASIIPVGAQTYWLATGVYEDESERNLTELVKWSTSDSSILVTLPGDPGGIQAQSQGVANVKIKLGSVSTSESMTVIP